MGIDYGAWKFWLDVVQAVATMLLGIYVWLTNRHRVTIDKISALENKLDERHDRQKLNCGHHKDRTTCLEVNMEHLPKSKDMASLGMSVNDLIGKLSKLEGRLEGINRAVDLLNRHHLDGRVK